MKANRVALDANPEFFAIAPGKEAIRRRRLIIRWQTHSRTKRILRLGEVSLAGVSSKYAPDGQNDIHLSCVDVTLPGS